jgi:Transposase DDE domain group 1
MGLMKRMLGHLGFEAALAQCGLPQPGSNRGYAPSQLITQFMLSVWCGANRFEHGEVTRHDPVLGRIFGIKRMANFKAVMRLFQRFTQGSNQGVMDSLYRWLFGQVAVNGITLDLDSTVMTRYGTQQGAAKGYNPAKRGRLSHHPLMAFVAETQMIANCWLRPGNVASASNVHSFLENTLHRLGDKRVALLRADSGFSDNAFLDVLEAKQLHYAIALKQTQPLQRALVNASMGGHGWWPVLDERGQVVPGIELTRFSYQAARWSRPRWVTGIRQHIEQRAAPKGKSLSLFADDPVIGKWRFSAIVSDLDLPAQAIWRTYRGRATCENRIRELKYDFAADSFAMQNFWATEAALGAVMLAYNLMSLFRQVLLKSVIIKQGIKVPIQHTLQTLRYKLFARPAYTTMQSRKPILNLALAMQKRTWMQGLWDAANAFELPARFATEYPPWRL